MTTRQEAQNVLSQWSRPWFNINGPNTVWLSLVNFTRARTPVEAFRRHCYFALIEAAVRRARLASATPGIRPAQDPLCRLNQLLLTQWVDPVVDHFSSARLGATTHVAYCANSFQEDHVMEATLDGPSVHVRISLQVRGTPSSILREYTAIEDHDAYNMLTYLDAAVVGEPVRPAPARQPGHH